MGNEDNREDERGQNINSAANSSNKLNIIEERLVVGKDKVETGKVVLHKRVIEENVPLDLELFEEHMDVEVKKIGKVVDTMGPAIRHEGDTKIFSVYREIYVKQTILEEEVRITKKQTTKPFHTSEKLRREVINVERISGEQSLGNSKRENKNTNRSSRDNRQGDNTAFNEQGDLSGSGHLRD